MLRQSILRAPHHLLVACAVLTVGGCADRVTPPTDVVRAPVTITATLTPEQQAVVAGMSVEVTGPGITTPIIVTLAVNAATVNGTVNVPIGASRTFTVRAFDAQGTETYNGSATATVVAGTNPPLTVRMTAVEGSVPIDVTIGTYGVTLTPPTATIVVNGEATLTANVTANGSSVPGALTWGVVNPALVTLTVAGDGRSAVVRGKIAGSTTVVASYQGVAAASTITVTPAPTHNLGATRLTAGLDFSCALANGGLAYCWGANASGQLGTGTTTESAFPLPVSMPAGVTFTTLQSGALHTCATGSDGNVYCWGGNAYGQLGLGDTATRTRPTAVPSNMRPASMGYYQSCNSSGSGGANQCGGRSGSSASYSLTPVARMMPPGAQSYFVTAGGYQTCGYVIFPPTGPSQQLKQIDCSGISGSVTINAGVTLGTLWVADGYACNNYASQGGMQCFGSNGYGQWGTSSTSSPSSTGTYAPTAFGSTFTCSSSSCAGSNSNGELGNGGASVSFGTPATISGGSMSGIAVSQGGSHVCGIRGGIAYCWGLNTSGQLGNGTKTSSNVPFGVLVQGI